MSERLRAVHAVATIEEEASGIAYCVPRLCEALARRGVDVTMLSLGTPLEDRARGYSDRRFRRDFAGLPVAGALGLSRALSKAAAATIPDADIVHCHGLWQMPMIDAAREARRRGKPLVLAPHGMLGAAALAFSPRKKALFSAAWQRRVDKQAACLHATSSQEHDDIREAGLTNPIAVVPNGIDVPEATTKALLSEIRTLLWLGRVHPKKGLDTLVAAWARIEASHPAWRLRIAGPDERGHTDELRALAERLGTTRIAFQGPVFGVNKLAAYRAAELFVLPSLNENFAMTVAEALAAGTPVVCTKGSPWSGLEANGCGWWVDQSVEALAAALAGAMTLPAATLAAMGARGREWMARDFSWDAAGRDMLAVYEWLAGRAEMPEVVSLK
jgi:glycosyltransferase involved in cell wall biosynthesis